MQTLSGTIKHENWTEKPYHEAPPQKSTTADIDCVFEGDVEARARTSFLMQYPSDTFCHYCGYLLVDGTLAGRKGSFIIHEVGTWENGVASSRWEIVRGSGTGDLAGIAGTGSYAAEHDKTVRYRLDCTWPE